MEVHISSHRKSIILQNPSDTNFIILQNPSMFREIEKNIQTQTKVKQSTWTKTLEYKHWNLEEYKTEQEDLVELWIFIKIKTHIQMGYSISKKIW